MTLFQCAGAPLTILHLIGVMKGMSSGPFHPGGLGFFTQRIHSSIAMSLSLEVSSSALTKDYDLQLLFSTPVFSGECFSPCKAF